MNQSGSLGISPSGLAYLDPQKIRRNPQNPRLLFNPDTMALLKKSISEVGILVPLIVYSSSNSESYFLLDGERRWRCALELGLKVVPANIIPEPDVTKNLLTMFNIHNVREDWELTPMALKLEMLMRLLKEDSDNRIAELTGLRPSNVRRCKTLLRFDRRYLDMTLLDSSPDKLTGDFFVELYPILTMIRKQLPEVAEKYNDDRVIEIMVSKYRKKSITSVTEFRKFRDLVRLVKKGVARERISASVEELLKEPEMGITEAYEKTAATYYQVQRLVRQSEKLNESLREVNVRNISRPTEFVEALVQLRQTVDELLKRIRKNS